MMPALLLLALAQTYDPASQWPGQPSLRPRVFRSDGPERTSRAGISDGATKLGLCDILQAGDKSGAWDCLKGDGTMLSGSATTWVPTGSPTNSVENGAAVRTYTTAQNDQQPANAAFPASDFSMCQHVRFSSVAAQTGVAFGTSGSAAAYSTISYEMNASLTATNTYFSDGGGGATVYNRAFVYSAGTWYLICVTYVRVGGAANNTVDVYVNGSSLGSRSTEALVQALASRWSSNGYVGASNAGAKSVRGTFVTYKALSGADISRIYAAIP